MKTWVKGIVITGLMLLLGLGCGKDEKSSADKSADVQKALQEGMQKEQKMYEGMQKGAENLEKAMKEQKEKSK